MQYSFNYSDIKQQVLDFMRSLNVQPRDERDIIIDGYLHRYSTHDDKSYNQSGAFCIFTDGIPAGWVQDWRKGEAVNWHYDMSTLDNEQCTYFNSDEFKQKAERERKEAEEKRKDKQNKAISLARQSWHDLKPAPDNHPYLISKKVKNYGLHFNEDTKALAVPLRDISGQVQSLQWIRPDGQKRFFEGAPTEGAFFAVALDLVDDKYTGAVLLAEGYATAAKLYELTGLPSVAAINCHALMEVARLLKEKYPKCVILVMADDDKETELKHGFNPGLREAQKVVSKKLAKAVISPPFTSPDEGTDWDDYAIKHGEPKTTGILQQKISFALMPSRIQSLMPRIGIINAEELRHKKFDPITWAVPGFLPAGFTLLGGAPKIGKSTLALHVGIGVAVGGCVLGKLKVEQGSVLYLALEDTEERLKERLNSSDVPKECILTHMDIVYTTPRQDEGGLDFIEWWIQSHSNARLVIIDTIQKFRKPLSGKGNIYAEDYDMVSELKAVADKYKVAFLGIHHLKKAKETDDWINEFSGSQGLAGAADTLFALKRTRTENMGILHRTGRDVEEKDFSMRLDNFGWYLEGEAEDFTMPTWKRQIMSYLQEHKTVSPMELATVYDISISAAKTNLHRLNKEGRIQKVGHGTYSLRA